MTQEGNNEDMHRERKRHCLQEGSISSTIALGLEQETDLREEGESIFLLLSKPHSSEHTEETVPNFPGELPACCPLNSLPQGHHSATKGIIMNRRGGLGTLKGSVGFKLTQGHREKDTLSKGES